MEPTRELRIRGKYDGTVAGSTRGHMANKKTPLVIYHAGCWDGFCAAWVAKNALGDIEPFAAHYGTLPPDVTGRVVYILDFCYPRAVMRRVLGEARKVVVLDHHKTSEAELAGIIDEFIQRPDLIATNLDANPGGQELPIVWFDMTKSGGRLTWEHFHLGVTDSRVPWLVEYTEDRDLWRHSLVWSREVNAALRTYPLDFGAWDRLAERPVATLLLEGEAVRRVEKQQIETHIRHAREIELAGHRIMAVNATVLFSEIAGELAAGRPFGACYFDRFDGKRQWSLRSDDNGLDVSQIAKQFGGGGHPHAAGFEQEIANV